MGLRDAGVFGTQAVPLLVYKVLLAQMCEQRCERPRQRSGCVPHGPWGLPMHSSRTPLKGMHLHVNGHRPIHSSFHTSSAEQFRGVNDAFHTSDH